MNRLRSFFAAACFCSAIACGPSPDTRPESSASPPAPAPTALPESAGANPELPTLDSLPARPAAPWSAAAIPASSVPKLYSDVWRVAENKSSCALLAPIEVGADVAKAIPRKATFSGGWAVAYDLPNERSLFGVAGSGADAWSPDVYSKWPHNKIWADSSSAGYGPEGGGAYSKWVAYLKIPGQQCLYNLWSNRGRSHIEELLESLRFVAAD